VRWQGWPILPPLHFREEAISLKLVYEKFYELPLYGVLRSSLVESARRTQQTTATG
jgi:hypothetical protein